MSWLGMYLGTLLPCFKSLGKGGTTGRKQLHLRAEKVLLDKWKNDVQLSNLALMGDFAFAVTFSPVQFPL